MLLIKEIDLKENTGYADDWRNKKQLNNGESGIGKSKDGGLTLVTSCGNCGDFHWLLIDDVLEFLKKGVKSYVRSKLQNKKSA